jgi:hypothetical protein
MIKAKHLKETNQVKATLGDLHFYIKNSDQPKLPEVRVQDAVITFIKQKSAQTKARKLPDRYTEELTYQLEAFGIAYPFTKSGTLTPIPLLSTSTTSKTIPSTITESRSPCSSSMALENKWLTKNPCDSIRKAALSEQPPEV